jgi:tetratricopeptide (TPR) repeat protein
VREITRLCGCLPLAIGMLARQLYHHPAWTLAGRAAELAAAVDRLELLATENLSVAAAFDLSYADLTPGQQRLFRRLALHPGTDIDPYAAAALDGTGLAAARRGLEGLYEQYLLTEPAPGRHRMHDLIREHVRALASRLDPGDDREQATGRLLDYYQHAAARAQALLARQTRAVSGPAADAAPADVPVLASREQALAWARAERTSLLTCLDQATAAGQHARVIALTAALEGLLRHDGPWGEAITRHAVAVQAARQLGDPPGEALALSNLGDARQLAGDYPGAAQNLQEALGICRDRGDRLGQVHALTWLGVVRRLTGDYPGAARDLQEVAEICSERGERVIRASALNYLGVVRRLTGDFPGAARDLQEAVGIFRCVGDRPLLAEALTRLAVVRRVTGDYPGAARDLQEALDISRQIGSPDAEVTAHNESGTLSRIRGDLGLARSCHQQALNLARQLRIVLEEAHALAGLGRCARAAGRTAEAEDKLRHALAILQQIGAAEAADVSAELDALPGTPDPAPASP